MPYGPLGRAFAVKTKIDVEQDFGAREGAADNTAALNAAFLSAKNTRRPVVIPAKNFRVKGKLLIENITVEADGATFIHVPDNDNTDCIEIVGANGGRTKIEGLTIRGMQDGHEYGRDAIRLAKGDYVQLMDITVINIKRDAFNARPTSSQQWVENLIIENFKVQGGEVYVDGVLTPVTRDGFHFELSGSATYTFMNQLTFINCETRSVYRYPWLFQNDITHNNTAQKISNVRIINCEVSGAPAPYALIKIQGSPGVAPIENINIEDCAVEDTTGGRTGPAIEITGKMSGLFRFENDIIYGTAAKIEGYELFPHVYIRDINAAAYVPIVNSHEGVQKKTRTGTIAAAGGNADVHMLADGEVLEIEVIERYNNSAFYGFFKTYHKANLVELGALNLDAKIVQGKSLYITSRATANGNISIVLDGTTFNVPITTANGATPDQVADVIAAYNFTGFRALRMNTQTIAFSKADETVPTLAATFAATGVNGTISDVSLLRIINTHASTNTDFEVLIKRLVKDTGS